MPPSPIDPTDPAYFESSTMRAMLAGYGPRDPEIQREQQQDAERGAPARMLGALLAFVSRVAALPTGGKAAQARRATRMGRRNRAIPPMVSVPSRGRAA